MPVRVIAGIKTLKEVDPVSTDIWVVTDTRVPISVLDRKSTRLNSSHLGISYAVFCLKKQNCSETTIRIMQDLKRIGVPLSLDDFGTFFFLLFRRPPSSPLFPNTALSR